MMGTAHELVISLTPEAAADVDAAVTRGEYDSPVEIVIEAVTEWRLRHRAETSESDELRRLAWEGIESGASLDAAEVFARLRARYGFSPEK